ncbi:MAG: hypothetical protein ABIF10_01090 [Candidatus Woesearchaeota archaeon]
MDFWNNQLTEKSWKILQELKGFSYILIGGWAAYLWTGLHKSKDIDIIVMEYADLEYLKQRYDLKKNDNLKKYEIKIEEIDIDIYVPHYSKFPIPPQDLGSHTARIQNFTVLNPEALLTLKLGAEKNREHSVKGEKDRIDIITILLKAPVDLKKFRRLTEKYKLGDYPKRLRIIVQGFRDTNYLGITPAQLKKLRMEIIEKMR